MSEAVSACEAMNPAGFKDPFILRPADIAMDGFSLCMRLPRAYYLAASEGSCVRTWLFPHHDRLVPLLPPEDSKLDEMV